MIKRMTPLTLIKLTIIAVAVGLQFYIGKNGVCEYMQELGFPLTNTFLCVSTIIYAFALAIPFFPGVKIGISLKYGLQNKVKFLPFLFSAFIGFLPVALIFISGYSSFI